MDNQEEITIIHLEQNNLRKPKEERIYVKSNKGKKIELKNLDQIKLIEESGSLDQYTQVQMSKIKNLTFKNNIFDLEAKLLVSSVRLVKSSKFGKRITPLIWEYYKNRGNLDINYIIKQYGRDNLIINYSTMNNIKMKTEIESDFGEIMLNDN